jgi:transposase-like protein
MAIILIRPKKTTNHPSSRPTQCPYCGSYLFHRWGKVKKSVKDKRDSKVTLYRYRCEACRRTFRDYPEGFDRSDYSMGRRQLAALLWALGLSYRDITSLFEKYGITLSRSTVWREGQVLSTHLDGLKLRSYREKYSIDPNYVHWVSSKMGVVLVIDVGNRQYAIVGTLNEYNPLSVQSWLSLLVKNLEVEIYQLETGKLDLFANSEVIATGELFA